MKTQFSKFLESLTQEKLVLYHGTKVSKEEGIKENGLVSEVPVASWYMLATDLDSAIFHAYAEEGSYAPVFVFEIPIGERPRWPGYPYLWKAHKRNDISSWYAIKETIPPEFIKEILHVPYEEWVNVKNKGF